MLRFETGTKILLDFSKNGMFRLMISLYWLMFSAGECGSKKPQMPFAITSTSDDAASNKMS